MVKLEIYNEKKEKEEEPLRLMLEKCQDGEINLVSVNENGELEWNILKIKQNGTLYKFDCIGAETKLALDGNGKIKEGCM